MPSDPLKPWGPDNPHPLSRMKTELVWEGKYDEYGNRRPVKLPSFPLVLQPIEHVDVPWDARKAQTPTLDFEEFRRQAHSDDFRNMLIWGDNKIALAALLEQFRGKVDLIYIDPPFDVGADFTMQIALGNEGDAVAKEQSVLEAVAYRDTWGKATDSYLNVMMERISLMRDMLSSRGSLFLHCDWRMNSYLRQILDEAFGRDCFRNEIIWRRAPNLGRQAASSQLGRVIDTILVYSKEAGAEFPGAPPTKSTPVEVNRQGRPIGAMWDERAQAYFTTAPRGDYTDASISHLREQNRVYESTTGTLSIKYFLRAGSDGRWYKESRVDTLWDDYDTRPLRHCPRDEDQGYDTQKPEGLLRRIVEWASSRESLVVDCFCGSGTTMAVAEKLGRRWIGVDLGRYAIHVSRKRLMGVQRELHQGGKPYRPFDVYNLCRYERQWWQMERLRGADHEHRSAVLRFFRAVRLDESPSPLLHGTKGGAMVHVAPIDTIVKLAEAEKVARAAGAAGAKRAIILAWEFEMDLRKRIEAVEAETGVHVAMKYIPREIMEPNRDEVQFFDTGALEAEAFVVDAKKRAVDVRLKSFIPSLAEVPEKELEAVRERAISSPFDFIDFWAVDFEHGAGKSYFDHHWHAYRTRKDRRLATESACQYGYQSPGRKRICVKVIDVFGVDTSVVVEVTV